jgi:hypothetical protein
MKQNRVSFFPESDNAMIRPLPLEADHVVLLDIQVQEQLGYMLI